LVRDHGVEDVGASAAEADEGGVVAFAFGAFAVVAGPADGVGAEGCEGGEEQRPLEVLVAAAGRAFPAERDS
jgi:hypothetical protein